MRRFTCHANNAYTAAAIMVRKTLEKLCADQGAKGATLHERIADLRTTIVVPKQLLDAAQELRLLGNDAANIHARTFGNVGSDEAEAAIELTKELLKAVYQMEMLLKKLTDLKQTPE